MNAARIVVVGSGLLTFAVWSAQWMRARRGRSETGRTVNENWRAGMLLEALAFAMLLFWRHRPQPAWVYVAASTLALASAFFGMLAGAHLREHFRAQAVVTSEHRLITSGPYSAVRHPIYASLLGLLLATAVVFSDPVALFAALPLYVMGTEIRTRAEDKLLAARFGAQFDAYRRRVRAYLPGVR